MSLDALFDASAAAPNKAEGITIRRPDDWHVHLRDGAMLRAVLPFTAGQFARGIIMPNLVPPVTTVDAAAAYRDRILAARPTGSDFEPLMTCYLTDTTSPDEIEKGYSEKVWFAAKLYPAGATTNAHHGVTDIKGLRPVLERMERIGMPVLIHGEATDPAVDVFDREAVFMEQSLLPLLRDHPGLKVVIEHVTTRETVEIVRAHAPRVAGTVTPHHLVINRTSIFQGGLRPHLYCLPVAKREHHRLALRQAVTSGDLLLLHWHRHRPASGQRQGGGVRLCRRLCRRHRAANLRAGIRRGGRAGQAGSLRVPEWRKFLWLAGQ